jgi:hypothetical protein
MAGTIHRHEHLIQVPLVAGSGPSMPELMGIGLAARAAPLPYRFLRHDAATGEQELLPIAGAETEAEIQPDAMTDELGREAVVPAAVARGCIHARRMAHASEAGQPAQQVDNARYTRLKTRSKLAERRMRTPAEVSSVCASGVIIVTNSQPSSPRCVRTVSSWWMRLPCSR